MNDYRRVRNVAFNMDVVRWRTNLCAFLLAAPAFPPDFPPDILMDLCFGGCGKVSGLIGLSGLMS
jgi:hypothetical protein